MNTNRFKFYSALSRLPLFRKSYAIKIMMAAFIGILIPLFMLIVYIMLNSTLYLSYNFNLLIVVLVATLLGIIVTLSLLYMLLSPIQSISTGLQQYINEEKKPTFPIGFEDSVGQLMTYVQHTIEKIDLLNSPKPAAMIDILTGLPNRQAGEKFLRQDIARACREKNQMLIVLFELQLKNIYEQFGHTLGDVCLTQITDTLSQSIREGDWLVRWNSNQFMMVLWNFNHAKPIAVLERIQQHSIKTPMGELLQLNLSVGAYRYKGNPDSDTESHFEKLLIGVNQALSQTKRDGGIILIEET